MTRTSAVVALLLAAFSAAFAGPKGARTLDEIEATHLTFMRSEELLARDVYLTLAQAYPDVDVFMNIGDGSEQTHTDSARDMLESYGLDDPNPDANDPSRELGTFTDADDRDYGGEYGWYFAEKYAALVAQGRLSLLDALYVGAFIEELDMADIIECPKIIVESDDSIGDEGCGLNYSSVRALKNLYKHLVDGSENHLRAFVKNIEARTGETYQAQVLTQDAVDAILGR